MLSNFPLCIKGWLQIRDSNDGEGSPEEWRSSGIISSANWHSKFCILMENDSRLYIFNNESNAEKLRIPSHIAQCRLDNELNTMHMTDSFIDDVSLTSSITRNQDSERYASNVSLSRRTSSKTSRIEGFFRHGSRFFRNSKEKRKLSDQTNNSNVYENNQSAKSVSNLKRSLSLSRIYSKKSEEKVNSKSSYNKSNNSVISQSTGDLTLVVESSSAILHNLTKDTNISEIHPSLVDERPYCFSLTSFAEEINIGSKLEKRTPNSLNTKRFFIANTNLERQCWMKRLHLTLKPNMENENRLNNSLKLTIFESKQLPSPKRRYYCTVNLDKSLYAKTTSKLVSDDGCVFWAEELVLNNLPPFKTLIISLYKESSPGKDLKKKKKKHSCIGQLLINLASLNNKSEMQSWFTLKSPDLLDLSLNNLIQLRINVRYQSLKVLRNDMYAPLYEIVTDHYLDFIQLFETNLPIKVKEEIAICLVNIHEKNGTILKFLIDLISEETSDLENSSMALRANTIVTKIIESHMKLVGFQYLRNMLYSFIRGVVYRDITIEVDPSRYDIDNESKQKLLLDNQHLLIEYLKHIWMKIYLSRNNVFPKQLKSIFVGWRKKLTSKDMKKSELEKYHLHCDVIISGCLFLRLLCPAILSPHLFGLVPYFFEKPAIQRTLTLLAKSLQSLANFSIFGEKEQFMTFLNPCFEEEIPRMREYLRSISSFLDNDDEIEAVNKDIHYHGAVIDLATEMAHLHKCLVSDGVKQVIYTNSKFQYMLKLPDIINKISQQLISFNVSQTFLPSKKSQIPNVISLDQRRVSIGQLLNVTIINDDKIDQGTSPPLLGSPILPSFLLDTVSEYTMHNDVEFKKITEQNNKVLNKPTQKKHRIYSKPQDNLSNNRKSQFHMFTTRRSSDNTSEVETKIKKGVSSQTSLPKILHFENQMKSSPKKSQPYTPKAAMKSSQAQFTRFSSKNLPNSHLDRVNDSLLLKHHVPRKLSQPKIKNVTNDDFYRDNPLYDTTDNTMTKRSSFDCNSYCSNAIDRYFDICNQVNLLEKNKLNGENGSGENEELHSLRQEMHCSRKQVQHDQMNDLKHLNDILHFSKSNAINRIIHRSNSQKLSKTNSEMNDVLDNVIKSIATDGAGLDATQENLRRLSNKGKSIIKYENSPSILAHNLSLDYVSIDISNNTSTVVPPSVHADASISSSTCSPLISGLI